MNIFENKLFDVPLWIKKLLLEKNKIYSVKNEINKYQRKNCKSIQNVRFNKKRKY